MIRTEMVDIDKIIIGKRARDQAYGLDPLERSISDNGVLHPIGIDQNYNLIFGFRRIHACKNLGMTQIPARIFTINVDDLYKRRLMEWEENIARLNLSAREQTLISMYVEEALKGRHGSNQYQAKGDPDKLSEAQAIIDAANQNSQKEDTPNLGAPLRGESADIAAQAVGWSGEKQRQAKAIFTSDNEEVKQAVDNNEISVHAGYKILENMKEQNSTDRSQADTIDKRLTFKITLSSPSRDARLLFSKGGKEYCTKLGVALLKKAGHKVEL